jgi:hypothetical protein
MSAPIPVFSDRPKAAPTPKLRALVKYPGNIVGTTGIDVTKQHGTVTVETDWTDFGAISAIPTSPTSFILTFDTATGAYVLVPSHLLGGAASGIADAPIDGTQYGRQSAGWTAIASSGGAAEGDYATHATVVAATIAYGVTHLRTAGYSVVGDGGGALYKKVPAIPTHAGKIQSADGAWWELTETIVRPQMFGGLATGSDIADVPWQQAVDYLVNKGVGGVLDVTGNWVIKEGVGFTANDLTVRSHGGSIQYAKPTHAFNHMLRFVGCNRITLDGLHIWSSGSLVFGDTGFVVQVSATAGMTITNCFFNQITTFPIWMDHTSGIFINGNRITTTGAGGMQLSNECTGFVIKGNLIEGTTDDAIGIVQDSVGSPPIQGTIVGNVIRNIGGRGNGISLISCQQVVVSSNFIFNIASTGIASYIYSGTTVRATDLTIVDNYIALTGQASLNLEACANIAMFGVNNSIIAGNILNGPRGSGFATNIANIRIRDFHDFIIKNNKIQGSANFGIHIPSSSVDGGPCTAGRTTIENNTFYDVTNTAIRINPTSTSDTISIVDNKFTLTGSAGAGRIIDVDHVGSLRLYIGGNKQLDQSRAIFVDTATCSNIFATDNTPAVALAYTVTATKADGTTAFTSATATGAYRRNGGLVYVHALVNITTAGGGGGVGITLPVPADAATGMFTWIDRSNGNFGSMEFASGTVIYTRGTVETSHDGAIIVIDGWYSPA